MKDCAAALGGEPFDEQPPAVAVGAAARLRRVTRREPHELSLGDGTAGLGVVPGPQVRWFG
jgi:hypothetical protein